MCSIIEGYAVVHQVKQTFRQILSCALLFFQDRENKILQLERQLDEQSGRLLALGSPNPDILTTENNMELGRNIIWIFKVQFTLGIVYKQATFLLPLDLMNKTMKRANEGLQKQCKEKEEVVLA